MSMVPNDCKNVKADQYVIKNVANTIKTGKKVVKVLKDNCQMWDISRHCWVFKETYETYEILPNLLSSLSLNHYPHLHPHSFWPDSCLVKKSQKTFTMVTTNVCPMVWYDSFKNLRFFFSTINKLFSVFFVKAEDNF